MKVRIKDWTENDHLVYKALLNAVAREVDNGRLYKKYNLFPVVYFTKQTVKLELLAMTRAAIRPLTNEEINASISNLTATWVKTSYGDDIIITAMFYTPEELNYMIDPDEYKDMTEEEKKERSIVEWMLWDKKHGTELKAAMEEEFAQAGIDVIVSLDEV